MYLARPLQTLRIFPGDHRSDSLFVIANLVVSRDEAISFSFPKETRGHHGASQIEAPRDNYFRLPRGFGKTESPRSDALDRHGGKSVPPRDDKEGSFRGSFSCPS